MKSFIHIILGMVFIFISPVTQGAEFKTIRVNACPEDMSGLLDGEACLFSQDWGSYAKGVRRSGCIMRTIYPLSSRPVDNFIGKWVYEYNQDSRLRKEKNFAKQEGYYQHDSQVGVWLTFDSEGTIIDREYSQPNEDIPLYNCQVKN